MMKQTGRERSGVLQKMYNAFAGQAVSPSSLVLGLWYMMSACPWYGALGTDLESWENLWIEGKLTFCFSLVITKGSSVLQ